MTKATTVGYGRHLLAAMAPMMMSMAPAPAMTKATTVGYGRHLLASAPMMMSMAPAPAMTKATTVGYGRHLLAAAPAPGGKWSVSETLPMCSLPGWPLLNLVMLV